MKGTEENPGTAETLSLEVTLLSGARPGRSDPLTSAMAERILERKGMMAQITHSSQKIMSTPEDCTPRSRSYWINNVASSCAGRAGKAWPKHTHLGLL